MAMRDIAHGGAALHQGVALPAMRGCDRAGIRPSGQPGLPALLAIGPTDDGACRHRGGDARPVRAILFDDTTAANRPPGRHRIRTIPVS
ncbi:MAG: hypothetical protein DI544_05305 [Sphingomonas taxi]|uniref:Uncharacterized protein n=1 Tax=Sphingomonas taxi TaxID=1549858 RepID=A0A2W5P8E9_9SPHN|nr:MAG: hypothetical protein DI544_05305 [Sphingomonas taxi]